MDKSTPLVSLVMRTLGDRPREIRRALNSVAANTWQQVEVIIVYQGAEGRKWDELQRIAKDLSPLPVSLLRNPKSGDRRAENLNIGWDFGRGRFIGFLDDDDTLEPGHIQLLVEAMAATGRTWAYSQTLLRKEDEEFRVVSETRPFLRKQFSLADMWNENFIPIHSLLIDRDGLVPQLKHRPFLDDLVRAEDWDFLLRISYYHEPAVIENYTCVYYVSTGTRNTNISLMNEGVNVEAEQRNREAWARCSVIVEQRKSNLVKQNWWAREYFKPAPPLRLPPGSTVAVGPQAAASERSTFSRLRRRAARVLIRMLERML
ncbi:glycosyltransferase family 2 protein [Bosea sp. 2RAB26]|uniref:glycosyltransferase family 2 protein n=1 Tax=Bosea sp. 2RAB26 TaxID=3237476 RepID=UPI003F91C71D